MTFLFIIILLGWLLAKTKILPQNSAVVLSRLETYLFIPALVLGSFMNNFTLGSLKTMGIAFLSGFAFLAINSVISILIAKCFSKDRFLKNLYTYGLAFPNFGFLGNAVVGTVFPQYLPSYIMFTLPLWVGINAWGAPILLSEKKPEYKNIWHRIKSIINPLMVAMLVGMLIGISGLKMPSFIDNAITTMGNCMSPVAMLLTGMAIAESNFLKLFAKIPNYFVSAIRLIVLPLISILVVYLFEIPTYLSVLIVCASSMPLGLNVVVIPKSFGRDVTDGSSMILISHLMAIISVPAMFTIFENVLKKSKH